MPPLMGWHYFIKTFENILNNTNVVKIKNNSIIIRRVFAFSLASSLGVIFFNISLTLSSPRKFSADVKRIIMVIIIENPTEKISGGFTIVARANIQHIKNFLMFYGNYLYYPIFVLNRVQLYPFPLVVRKVLSRCKSKHIFQVV